MTRLTQRYPEARQLVEKVNHEAAAGDSAGSKDGLGIRHVSSALLLQAEKQASLRFIGIAAVHTNDDTKDKNTAALFSSRALFFIVAALLEELKTVYKKTVPVNASRSEEHLYAQLIRTEVSSLSVRVVFLNSISLLADDPSDTKNNCRLRISTLSKSR